MAELRVRVWSFVIFPVGNSFADDESPFDWYRWLVLRQVPFLAAVHQPESDESKEHVHVIVVYDGKKSRDQALADFSHPNIPTSGPDCFVPVRSITGLEHYLTHVDFPERIHYSVDDFSLGCGYKLHIDDDGQSLNYLATIMSHVYQHRYDWTWNDCLLWCMTELPQALGTLRQSCYMIQCTLKRS